MCEASICRTCITYISLNYKRTSKKKKDRKRSCLGLGSEIAESKTIQYPLIFTPPPTKLTKYIVNQFLLDGGFHYKFPVPGCNFTVEIDEYSKPHQIIFFLDLVFEDAFTLINVADPRTAGEFDVAEESYEVPEGTDTSQYKCAFFKFLSEFQEEDTHSYIFRLLRESFRVDEARKPMSVTLRMKGRSKEGQRRKLSILLPFNDLLNACPKISRNSPIRFSHGPHLSPAFCYGHIELHLHLFKLPRTAPQQKRAQTRLPPAGPYVPFTASSKKLDASGKPVYTSETTSWGSWMSCFDR